MLLGQTGSDIRHVMVAILTVEIPKKVLLSLTVMVGSTDLHQSGQSTLILSYFFVRHMTMDYTRCYFYVDSKTSCLQDIPSSPHENTLHTCTDY